MATKTAKRRKKAASRGARRAPARRATARKAAKKRPAKTGKPAGSEPQQPVRPTGPGSFCWHELMTTDVEGAKKWYGALFGWGAKDGSVGTGAYTEWTLGGASLGGLMASPPGAPTGWSIYVLVENVDATAAKAAELGGKVCCPPTDIPTIGRFAVLMDPQGASIAVFQPLAR